MNLKKRREDFPASKNITVGSGGNGLDRAKTFISCCCSQQGTRIGHTGSLLTVTTLRDVYWELRDLG